MTTENKTYTTEEAIKAIRAYFEENENEYNAAIEELDSYNGYLGDDRYYSMSEIDEIYCNTDATEILMRAFYGYDEECYHTDSYGNREYGAFNPNREYFRYNGYGNLVSADYPDYSANLDNYFVESYIENAAQLWNIPGDVQEIIDNIDDGTEGANND